MQPSCRRPGNLLRRDDLRGFSEELTRIGDKWRLFAYSAARILKDRTSDVVSYTELSDLLRQCGADEKKLFMEMRKIKW